VEFDGFRYLEFKPDKHLMIDYFTAMSSTETILAIPGLSEEQRQ